MARGESTSTVFGINYVSTTSVATEVAQLLAPSCNRPQPATDNGVRDGPLNKKKLGSVD